MPKTKSQPISPIQHLRALGLKYPGAHTKSPWPGHLDLAVGGKTFAFLSADGEPFSISCKLPQSSEAALMLPFVSPTAYGMGKSGWVTAKLDEGESPPLDVLESWIEESYRAIAPKTLSRKLAAPAPSAKRARPAKRQRATPPSAAKKKATPVKAAKKKKAAKIKR